MEKCILALLNITKGSNPQLFQPPPIINSNQRFQPPPPQLFHTPHYSGVESKPIHSSLNLYNA